MNKKLLSAYFSELGKRGRGAKKARTSEQARAAVQARWAKHRARERELAGKD